MNYDDLGFVPLFPGSRPSPVHACIAVRSQADALAGWLVPLFQLADANVYLGALCDANGEPREWLEVWVQTVAGSRDWNRDLGADWNNAYLDARWRERCESLARLTPDDVYRGPWETEHPLPLYLVSDQEGRWSGVHPRHPDARHGEGWRLCQEDLVLKRAGLPPFTAGTRRYLVDMSAEAEPLFVGVGQAVPVGGRVAAANPATGFEPQWIPFNPEAGLLFLRRCPLLSAVQFKRLLEGDSWSGLGQGRRRPLLAGENERFRRAAQLRDHHGLLFSGRRGRASRVLERFILKLSLFHEILLSVASAVRFENLPFLDLKSDDIWVWLEPDSGRLPRWWGFRVHLRRTSGAVASAVENGEHRLFRPIRAIEPSIYRPKELAREREGRATIRLREVRSSGEGQVVCEGTLESIELAGVGQSDLLAIDLPLPPSRRVFHARVLPRESLSSGEVRFETWPAAIDRAQQDRLSAIRGSPLGDVSFRLLTPLSSPCDLHALAIIGLEIMLDHRKVDLPKAVDECFSLARQMALQPPELPIGTRRDRVLQLESRFWECLGPQNMCRENLSQEEALASIPADLWWGVFDALVRMLPGQVPDGWAADLGDVNPQALDSCMLPAFEEIGCLIERGKSLLFADWHANHEVLTVIDDFV